jgi:hypothetical protein
MRLGLIMFTALWLALGTGAWAANIESQKVLGEYFAKQGEVLLVVYPPITGPELGVALVAAKTADGAAPASAQLIAARVAGRREVQQVLAETYALAGGAPQFALLMNGKHLLTYNPTPWKDAAGQDHARGDLRIRDLEAQGGPKQLYELKDVVDLGLPAGSVQYSDCLLWQPRQHFLNAHGVLPVRNNYVQLSCNPDKNEYTLFQHLTALPDAEKVDSANLNDRALLFYRLGALTDSARLLEQAYSLAESDQSIVAHNQELVKGEITELSRQLQHAEGRQGDRALMYFWQGDFRLSLGALDSRKREGMTDLDAGLAGLALAFLDRWPEVDSLSVELERRKVPFLAEYISYLVDIADLQNHADISSTYLQALGAVGSNTPAYAAWYAEALDRRGKSAEAATALEQYLATHPGGSVNAAPRLKLCELYTRLGNSAGVGQLAKDALAGPLTDLQAYAQLADYYDLSAARREIRPEGDRLIAPQGKLDTFGIN